MNLLQSDRIPSLDGIRAISILLVVASHAASTANFPHLGILMPWIFTSGTTGVRVFFVISGFLITVLLLAEERRYGRISLCAFYSRRSLRIMPVYYCYIVTVYIFDRLILGHSSIGSADYIKAATYSAGLLGIGTWDFAHVWSLAVEEHFYLLWPLVFSVSNTKWRFLLVVFAAVLCLLARLLLCMVQSMGLAKFTILGQGDVLVWGCGAALFSWHFPIATESVLRYRPRFFRFASLMLIALMARLEISRLGPVFFPVSVTVQSIATTYLIGSYTRIPGGVIYQGLNCRPAVLIGVLSYSIYIWQQPVLYHHEMTAQPLWWQIFPQNIGVVLLVAVCSFICIERPFLLLKRHFGRRAIVEHK